MLRVFLIFGVMGLAAAAEKPGAVPKRARQPAMAAKPTTARPNLNIPLKPPPAAPKTSPLLQPSNSPINTLDRWNKMSPEQRAKAMAKLSPERRLQMQDRLEKFNALPREEQDRLRRRYERFSHLSGEKQDVVRRQIQAFTRLPDARRPGISREFEQLRRMSSDDRRARMNSEEFRNRYTPREQQLLSDLSENLALRSAR
jgi:hypothetical protein